VQEFKEMNAGETHIEVEEVAQIHLAEEEISMKELDFD
jgi:hypothetical protein